MLLVNFLPAQKRTLSKRVEPLFLGAAALVFVGLCGWLIPSYEISEQRPLTIEERETVVSALARLEAHVPEASEAVEDLTDHLTRSVRTAFVAPDVSDEALVRTEEETFLFSPRFFEADSYSQEISLAETLDTMHPSDRPEIPESLARRVK